MLAWCAWWWQGAGFLNQGAEGTGWDAHWRGWCHQQEELVTANTPTRLALENTQTAANIRNWRTVRLQTVLAGWCLIGTGWNWTATDCSLRWSWSSLSWTRRVANSMQEPPRSSISEAAVAAVGSEQSAGRMLDLASRLEQQGGGYGAFSGVNSWLRNATGNQDAWTQTRQEYVRLRNTQAIKSLPPGPATDKDIMLAMKGFPPENADAATIASLPAWHGQDVAVRGSVWKRPVGMGQLGRLSGRSRTDINIGGIQVPAGTTYVDFARQFMDQRAQDLAAQQAGRAVAGRGYMRWAQPETGAVPGAAPAPAAPAAPGGALGGGTFMLPGR